MVSLKSIRIEDKKIEVVKQWPELQSVRNIQVFLGFANFYRQFIQGFSWIAAQLASILKTSGNLESLTQPGKGRVEVSGNNRAKYDGSKIDDEVDNEIDDKVEKRGQNPSKSKNLSKSKKTELGFLISGARMALIKLRQAFIKAPILHHLDPERYIQVETDVSGYAIGAVLSQLTLDNLGQ